MLPPLLQVVLITRKFSPLIGTKQTRWCGRRERGSEIYNLTKPICPSTGRVALRTKRSIKSQKVRLKSRGQRDRSRRGGRYESGHAVSGSRVADPTTLNVSASDGCSITWAFSASNWNLMSSLWFEFNVESSLCLRWHALTTKEIFYSGMQDPIIRLPHWRGHLKHHF